MIDVPPCQVLSRPRAFIWQNGWQEGSGECDAGVKDTPVECDRRGHNRPSQRSITCLKQ